MKEIKVAGMTYDYHGKDAIVYECNVCGARSLNKEDIAKCLDKHIRKFHEDEGKNI